MMMLMIDDDDDYYCCCCYDDDDDDEHASLSHDACFHVSSLLRCMRCKQLCFDDHPRPIYKRHRLS